MEHGDVPTTAQPVEKLHERARALGNSNREIRSSDSPAQRPPIIERVQLGSFIVERADNLALSIRLVDTVGGSLVSSEVP